MRVRAVGLVPVPLLYKLAREVVGAAPLEPDHAQERPEVVRGAVGAHVLAVLTGTTEIFCGLNAGSLLQSGSGKTHVLPMACSISRSDVFNVPLTRTTRTPLYWSPCPFIFHG